MMMMKTYENKQLISTMEILLLVHNTMIVYKPIWIS
jgi:hypothetical protein